MSNTHRPPRRSTRINEAVALTVEGVDFYRAPYREDVSTVTVNCHGCKYLSKYEVLTKSWVILELNDRKDSQPVSVRGRVKWVKRPIDSGGALFETAIELDDPGNIWGIDSPPSDWLPFCGPRTVEGDTSKPKPFAVPKPELLVKASKDEKRGKDSGARESNFPLSLSSGEPRVGLLMGEFQRQMEKMLSEAAVAAVQERATVTLDDVRAGLREEAKHILSEATASQAGPWIEQSLKQMKQSGLEYVRAIHSQWTKKLEADTKQAIGRIEARQRELDEHSENLAAKTVERVQQALEASRKDVVDRIISRLKEQIAPQLDQARKAAADLAQRKEQIEKTLEGSMEKFSARIEKACSGVEKQFELIIRERLDSAREELELAGKETTTLSLKNLRVSSETYDAVAQTQLREALERVAESALKGFKEKISETSSEFAAEVNDYSRSHLEYVGGAISELAKGIGKRSKD